jgi:8-oxo-dGTP diphosphatase
MGRTRRSQRVAAYALILRDERILLSRLSDQIAREERWTLPGGGVDHGEDPGDAVVREVHEETGLAATVGDTARVYSARMRRRGGRGRSRDHHALRLVYEGWVAPDAPSPEVQEVGGSTVAAAWHPLADVVAGTVPVVPMVLEALADHRPHRLQRVAAYALVERGDSVLLTRISERGHHAGAWTLPGGGIGHGESPERALVREVAEECGVEAEVRDLLLVHDVHFTGTAPTGRHEDFHGLHLVYAAEVAEDADPRVVEVDGTTDAVDWVPRARVESGAVPVLEVVRAALAAVPAR